MIAVWVNRQVMNKRIFGTRVKLVRAQEIENNRSKYISK